MTGADALHEVVRREMDAREARRVCPHLVIEEVRILDETGAPIAWICAHCGREIGSGEPAAFVPEK